MCGGGHSMPVAETIKTPMGETGTAAPAVAKRKPQSLLSRAVVDSSGTQPAVGMKQTLGA